MKVDFFGELPFLSAVWLAPSHAKPKVERGQRQHRSTIWSKLGTLAGLNRFLEDTTFSSVAGTSQSRSLSHHSAVRCSAGDANETYGAKPSAGDTLVKVLSAANEVRDLVLLVCIVGFKSMTLASVRWDRKHDRKLQSRFACMAT
jgi:hypothetical protein